MNLRTVFTKVSLQNIKSINSKCDIECGTLTGLIGDNGSGKSTFLQSLALLSQNIAQLNLDDGKILRLGGYNELVNKKDKPITISLEGDIEMLSEGYEYANKLRYNLVMDFEKNGMKEIEMSLSYVPDSNNINSEKLGKDGDLLLHGVWNGGSQISEQITFYDSIEAVVIDADISVDPSLQFSVNRWHVNPTTTSNRRLTRFFRTITNTIQNELSKISYIPALRGIDTFSQELLSEVTRHPVDSYNFKKQSDLLASKLAYDRDIEEEVSEFMYAILNRKCRARVSLGRLVAVETHDGNKWINIMNEGFGSNPLIHLAYQVISSEPHAMILIEEPEIHLFPAAQKNLIVQLIKYVKNKGKQIMLTTHSPHVYSMIKQLSETDENFKLYFVKKDDETRQTSTVKINSDNEESILKDFMGSSRDELADIISASGIG